MDRPILFSGAMVNAVLDGRKTQTRRPVRWLPGQAPGEIGFLPDSGSVRDVTNGIAWCHWIGGAWAWWKDGACTCAPATRSPFGLPGSHLWVREAWSLYSTDRLGEFGEGPEVLDCAWDKQVPTAAQPPNTAVLYRATEAYDPDDRWRSSIHMPRWASRLTLEVTGIRVERLHDITEDDARAEGIDAFDGMLDEVAICHAAKAMGMCAEDARPWFATAWNLINGKRATWESNPWVWVVSFRRVEA